ncbi:MAG: response regulator [Acetobacteraceae bacterium]|nr:response regulator [Acetobacteraceae bacterium]
MQIYTEASVYRQRQTELNDAALRQVELANADLTSIIDSAKQIGGVIGTFPEVMNLTVVGPGDVGPVVADPVVADPGLAGAGPVADCNERLAALHRSLSAYRFFAVTDAAGRPICASSNPLIAPQTAAPAWIAPLLGEPGSDIGEYATAPDIEGPFLPIGVPLPGERGLIVAALDLRWLSRHLQETQLERPSRLPNATLALADRRGTVIARFPEAEQWTGRPLPDWVRPLITGARPTTGVVSSVDGGRELAAFIPGSLPPVGLMAVEFLDRSTAMADTETTVWRNGGLMAAAVLVALALAWLFGRRFLDRPAEALIAAADRWRNGDLHARAEIAGSAGAFSDLAGAFNTMAATLEPREQAQRQQADRLTALVAERSRELSSSNNRLQVEIAEREKTETALNHAQKLQAVGQLAGGISHDFNNMLTTVLGSLELMERRVATVPQRWTEADAERLRTLITRAIAAVGRGADLSSGLLRFARRPRADARPTDVNRLITDLLTLATSALGRRVRLVTELEEAPWPIHVDPSQVEAAVLNLCLNARDAMPEGGTLTIRTANTMVTAGQTAPQMAAPGLPADDALPPGPYVSIAIIDTGTGMTPEVQRRAFDPFFSTKGDAGSGLGLSQVQGMVRQAGGTVRLRSTPGSGTEITLLLPRANVEATAATLAPHAAAPVRHKLPAMTVMVVDDDQAVRQVTVEMLRDLGCEVLQAPGGAEALALLAKTGKPPDILLVDYAMPGMNGLTLARRLREDGLTVPIGMVTGYAELAEVDAGESPLDGLLRKPFTIDELQALVVRLAARGRPRSNIVRLPVPQRG